jgi:catechol 2,3-dioxygenase-like lactoylglutathione lyase family enzyme
VAARLRHIALGTDDPLGMGRFYADALGFELLVHNDNVAILTDGTMNIVLARGHLFEPSAVCQPGFVGFHHMGFQVDSRDEVEGRLLELRAVRVPDDEPVDGHDDENRGFEEKWVAPDGLIFDISEEGWPTAPKAAASHE